MTKKTNVIITAIIALFLLGIIGYALFGCVRGSGKIGEKSFELAEFNSIEISLASARVYLAQGHKNYLRLEGDDNILEKIKPQVDKEGVLKIWHKGLWGCFRPTQEINLYLTAEEIKRLYFFGEGEIIGQSRIKNDDLEIKISGSGKADLEIESKDFFFELSGTGKAILKGRSDNAEFKLRGSGKIIAQDLATRTNKISISGNGEAQLAAIDNLDINISGSGKLLYKGSPKNITQSISGLGKVEKLEGTVNMLGIPANEDAIRQAFLNKYPNWKAKDINIYIAQKLDEHAAGTIGFKDESAGGGLWFAALTEVGWIIAWDGNGTISCEEIESYAFPESMIEECVDSQGNIIKRN